MKNMHIPTIILLIFAFFNPCASQEKDSFNSEYVLTSSNAFVNTNYTYVISMNKGTQNIKHNLYSINLKMDTIINNQANLLISIDVMHKGYYVSPLAKKDYSGKLSMDLGSYQHMDFGGEIVVVSISDDKFDIDDHINKSTDWIKSDAAYRQPFKIVSEEDFEVYGRLKFVIEPACTMEEIPFLIKHKDGQLYFIEPK